MKVTPLARLEVECAGGGGSPGGLVVGSESAVIAAQWAPGA